MEASTRCPKCGASLFWGDDIGWYCTSCGYKAPAKQPPIISARGARSQIEQPGDSDLNIYSGLAKPTRFGAGGEAPHFFNWGALLLNIFWCFAMRLWGWAYGFLFVPVAVAIIVKVMVASTLLPRTAGDFFFIPIVATVSVVIMLLSGLYLGSDGNRIAWLARPFKDVDHFLKVQRAWSKVGLIVAVFFSICVVIGLGIYGAKLLERSREEVEEPGFAPTMNEGARIDGPAGRLVAGAFPGRGRASTRL